MRHHREVFEAMRARPGMYVRDVRYSVVAAFLLGYDAACEGGVLVGFREWLAVRLGAGWNLDWQALVLDIAFPETQSAEAAVSASPDSEQRAIDTLFALIAEFEEARRGPDALMTIYASYQKAAPANPSSVSVRKRE